MLIIVALIGLLVQLAAPKFSNYIIKAYRLGAKSELIQAQISLENCYLLHKDYQVCKLNISSEHYLIDMQTSQHTFTLALKPKDYTPPGQDTECYRWQVDEKNNWQVFTRESVGSNDRCLW